MIGEIILGVFWGIVEALVDHRLPICVISGAGALLLRRFEGPILLFFLLAVITLITSVIGFIFEEKRSYKGVMAVSGICWSIIILQVLHPIF